MHLRYLSRRTSVKNKKVLVRADFNVPLTNGAVDPFGKWRISQAIPTIRYLMKNRAKVILVAHLGRPGGRVKRSLSLAPVGEVLGKLLKKRVVFISKTIGREVEECVRKLRPGEVILLENVRFHPGERKNSKGLAFELSRLADIYVNEAFAVSHRCHASIAAITHYLPAYEGFLFAKEIKILRSLKEKPVKPFIVIIGGAKIGSKLGVIASLINHASSILIGGDTANAVLRTYKGIPQAPNERSAVKKIIALRRKTAKIFLPNDLIVMKRGKALNIKTSQMGHKNSIIDIGHETVNLFLKKVVQARTIIWNGPMGIIETKEGRGATAKLARAIAKSKAKSFIGGGETVEIVSRLGIIHDFTYVSTGGGAMLMFLAGEELPGLKALLSKRS